MVRACGMNEEQEGSIQAFVGKTGEQKIIWKTYVYDDDEKMCLHEIPWEGMTGPRQGQVAGSGEHGNKTFRLHNIKGIC
jgi:hypothetical protein